MFLVVLVGVIVRCRSYCCSSRCRWCSLSLCYRCSWFLRRPFLLVLAAFSSCGILFEAKPMETFAARVRLGSFAFGLGQTNLEPWDARRFQRVVHRLTTEGDLHILCGSQFGSFQEGPSKAYIDLGKEIRGLLPYATDIRVMDNSFVLFNMHGDDASPVSTEKLDVDVRAGPVIQLLASNALPAQIGLLELGISDGSKQNSVFIGSLQVNMNGDRPPPSIALRKSVLKDAMQHLDGFTTNSASQPVAKVLYGDFGLTKEFALECMQEDTVQPTQFSSWSVSSATGEQTGDLLFLKGVRATGFDLPVGSNFRDHGMLTSPHDAFGVEFELVLHPSLLQMALERSRPLTQPALLERPIGPRANDDSWWFGSETIEVAALPPLPSQAADEDVPLILSTCTTSAADAVDSDDDRSARWTRSSTPSPQPLSPPSSPRSNEGPQRKRPRNVGSDDPDARCRACCMRICESMRTWYEAEVERTPVGTSPTAALKHIQRVLYRHLESPVMKEQGSLGDIHYRPSVSMVQSRRYSYDMVQETLRRREEWLRKWNYPMDLVMNDSQIDAFNDELKSEFHDRPDQQERAWSSWYTRRKGNWHSRWSRQQQIRCGSKVIWELVSYTGRWDPQWLDARIRSCDDQETEKSEEKIARQKALKIAASEAKSAFRWGRKCSHYWHNVLRENWYEWWWLSPSTQDLIVRYDDDSLRRELNAAVRRLNSGRLYEIDGSFHDIGGNPEGLTRRIMRSIIVPDYRDWTRLRLLCRGAVQPSGTSHDGSSWNPPCAVEDG